jgi:hypothetical protein
MSSIAQRPRSQARSYRISFSRSDLRTQLSGASLATTLVDRDNLEAEMAELKPNACLSGKRSHCDRVNRVRFNRHVALKNSAVQSNTSFEESFGGSIFCHYDSWTFY